MFSRVEADPEIREGGRGRDHNSEVGEATPGGEAETAEAEVTRGHPVVCQNGHPEDQIHQAQNSCRHSAEKTEGKNGTAIVFATQTSSNLHPGVITSKIF